MFDDLTSDVRIALRGLMRSPGPALIAVLALGLGIGLTSGMFSVVNGVILKGLPVDDADELVGINRVNPSQGPNRLLTRIHDFTDLRERQVAFEDLAAYEGTAFNMSTGEGPPEFVNGANITTNSFDLLRTAPARGRGFLPADGEVGAAPVALIADRMWRDQFGSEPGVVGSVVRIDGEPTEIVGVMPAGFEFPVNQQLWRPLPPADLAQQRGSGPSILAFGRLSPGVSIEEGEADLVRIMAQLAEEYPDTNEGMSVVVGPLVHEMIGYQIPPLLYTMLGAVALVLLIACANVANLLLARASLRSKEVALKTALGASRPRIVAQMLVDVGVIAGLGAAVGLGVARLWIAFFESTLSAFPQGVPFWFSIGIDPTVLFFVLALTLASTLLAGLAPALRASRVDVNDFLKDETRGSSSLRVGRLSRGLVVAEVAFSCALLVAAGLVIQSVRNLTNHDYPFDGTNVFIAAVSLPPSDYQTDDDRLRFFDALRQRLDAEPGVVSSSLATELPAVGFGNGRFEIENETYLGDRDYPSARIGSVDHAYFETLSSTLDEGRAFMPTDDATSEPVAVVNSKFADTYFAGESAVGHRVRLRRVSQNGVEIREREGWYTIVGVAPDFYLDGDAFILAPEAIYVPLAQRASSVVNVMVRTREDPLQITARVREIVAELDPDLPISQVNSLGEAIRVGTGFFGIFGTMFTVFGGAALFLAAVGLYGVLSFSVNQRRQELGLRMALGATKGRVLRWVLGQASLQLGLGVAIGIVLSVALGRGLAFILFEVEAMDAAVLGGVLAILTLTGLLACVVPAARATRVDPGVAMHSS